MWCLPYAVTHSDVNPVKSAFPGGHCEPNDKSSAHAAMRECSEELGID